MHMEFIQLIQSQWRCYLYSFQPRRKAWMIETNRGPLFVKSYSSPSKAEWIVNLSEQLRERGFRQTVEYVYTAQGLPFTAYKGSYLVAMKPIWGRDADYSLVHDSLHTIKCLGAFHYHAKGIEGGPRLYTDSAPLIDKWEDRLGRFVDIIQFLRKRGHGVLERYIVHFAPHIINEARGTLDFARRSPLSLEYSEAVNKQCVAHRDLASHNFLIGNHTYLIDYDTSTYDTQLVDLIQMIHRVMEQQCWNFDVYAALMKKYEQYVALTDQQRVLSYMLLRYPDNFMREVIGLYEERNPWVNPKIEQYLMMIMHNWEVRKQFFRRSHPFFLAYNLEGSSIVV